MKILHCCLANFYIDNYGYQENILPKMHKAQGHKVRIVASTETYLENLKLGYLHAGSYVSRDGIRVTRLPYTKWLPHSIVKKIRIYVGLYAEIESFKPDIIFLHDTQFLSIHTIIKYAKKNHVKIYVDSHTDFINSGKSWISKYIFHKCIYKYGIKRIEKYINKFYGTLPLRCDFLSSVYGINADKIELLPFGVDDSLFIYEEKLKYKEEIRQVLRIPINDVVIITGGKIDKRKNIHILLEAFNDFVKENNTNNLHLIVFGKPTEEMKFIIDKLINQKYIYYREWIDSKKLYKYFFASDIAFFPGTHSVLWEEAVGVGIPAVFYGREGIMHLDKGGNCMYISNNNYDGIKDTITNLYLHPHKISDMAQIASIVGPKYFSYSNIAKQAIELN